MDGEPMKTVLTTGLAATRGEPTGAKTASSALSAEATTNRLCATGLFPMKSKLLITIKLWLKPADRGLNTNLLLSF